jgi:hypothetical protein
MNRERIGNIRDSDYSRAATQRPWLWVLNMAVKLLLISLMIFSVTAPDLPQFTGKAMTVRALTYPLPVLLIPVLWWLRGRPPPYPHLLDALIALPFLIDVAGNATNLYNTWRYFDDIAHFCNWVSLTVAFGAIMISLPIGRLNAAALVVGFGASTHVLWEIAEYLVMLLGSSGLQLTYEDTIGDLAFSFCGSLVGALIAVTLLWGRSYVNPVLFGTKATQPAEEAEVPK